VSTAQAELTPAAGAMTPRPFRVARRMRETRDTWTLELEPAGGEPLEPQPGQFTMLYSFGVGEAPISVSGRGTGPLVHTVRSVGAVSEAICATRPGEVLGVRGPFGNAWPLEQAAGADLVIVAGGIGLAPLRGAVYAAIDRRAEFAEVAVLYGSRTPADLLFPRELERWRQHDGLRVEVTVDSAGLEWRGQVGVVGKLVATARFDPGSAVCLLCGPEVMMRYTALALLERGVPAGRIFVSMERNMRCGLGHCGHCQLGPTLICRDGPVYPYDVAERLIAVREL
jgi:anaerobic sulfite reductase subunit B